MSAAAAAAVPAVDYLFSIAEVCLIYHREFCLPEICSLTINRGSRAHMVQVFLDADTIWDSAHRETAN